MPLKEMNEPTKEAPKKEPKKQAKEKEPVAPESPWKILADGTKVRQGRKLPYEKEIEQFFVELSGAVAMADSFSAKAVEIKAPELAYGYARLAKDDPRVKAFFEKLLTGSAWSAALFPTVSLALIVGWHWGVVPPQLGVPVTLGTGLLPVTREEEQSMKAQAFKEQAEAAKTHATHPRGDAPKGDSDGNGGSAAS